MSFLKDIEENPVKEVDAPVKTMLLQDAKDIYRPKEDINKVEAMKTSGKYKSSDFSAFEKYGLGFGMAFRGLSDLPEEVSLFGKNFDLALEYFGGDKQEIERKKLNVITASRNLIKQKQERFKGVPEGVSDSFSSSLGGGAFNFSTALLGTVLGGPSIGLSINSALEFGSEVSARIPTTKEGEIDEKKITPEWAAKTTAGTVVYTGISSLLESKIGIASDKNIWNKPITSTVLKKIAKEIGLGAIYEGATEVLQGGASAGIRFLEGTITLDEFGEEAKGLWKDFAVASILSSTVGTSVAINQRANLKRAIRKRVDLTVKDKNISRKIADIIFEAGNTEITTLVSKELELSSELKNKHGLIYQNMGKAIDSAIKESGAFSDVDETELAVYVSDTSKLFADQVLAEANKRGTTIDAVINGADIKYEDGKIRLKNGENIIAENSVGDMELMQSGVKNDSIRLYRGLEQEFKKDYNLSSTDAPQGYSTWTDNPELAKQYAGENGRVYYIDLPKSELGKEIVDQNGERPLFIDNEKKAGLNNISGKEYLVYTYHDNYDVNQIKEFNNGKLKTDSETININGQEKTVYNTNGDRIAQSKEALENFYKWFGDSKVINEDGSPKVVYHGTRGKFDTFDITKSGESNKIAKVGFWFGDTEVFAENFASDIWYGEQDKSIVMPVYLSLKNPKIYESKSVDNSLYNDLTERIKDLDNQRKGMLEKRKEVMYRDGWAAAQELLKQEENLIKDIERLENERAELSYSDSYQRFKTEIYKEGGQTARDANIGGLGMDLNDPKAVQKYVEKLRSQGFDGIIIKDTTVDSGSAQAETNTQYVAFFPNQIKSTENEGTFNPKNDNIYKQGVKGSFNKRLNVIKLLKDADRTTLLHEGSHYFMNSLIDMNKAYQEKNMGNNLGIFDSLKELVGEPSEFGFSVEQNEKFARSFEQFIRTGEAKNDKLKNVFKRLAQWFKSIYTSATDIKYKDKNGKMKSVELSKQAKDFFDDITSSPYVDEDIFYQESLEEVKNIVKKVKEGKDITSEEINKLKEIRDYIKSSKKAMPSLKSLGKDFLGMIRERGGYNIKKMEGFDIKEMSGIKDTVGYRGVLNNSSERNENDLVRDYAEFMGVPESKEGILSEALDFLDTASINKTYSPLDNRAETRDQIIEYIDMLENEIDIDYAGLGDSIKRAERFLKREEKERNKLARNLYSLNENKLPEYLKSIIEEIKNSDMSAKEKNFYEKRLSQINNQLDLSNFVIDMGESVYRAKSKILKKELFKSINGFLEKSKPVKMGQRKKGKYDYETNKIFDTLRDFNNLTKEEAEEKLQIIKPEMMDEKIEISPSQDILNRFLSYKAKGSRADVRLFQKVAEDLRFLTETGKQAKNKKDFEDIVNRRNNVYEALEGIDKTKGEKSSIITKLSNVNASLIGNFDFYLNLIFGKNFMEKYSLIGAEKKNFVGVTKSVNNLIENVKSIYGFTTEQQALNKIQKMGFETGIILKENPDTMIYNKETGQLESSKLKAEYNLSKMHMIDIYNAIKNEEIKEDYYRVFGEEQINDVLQNLTEQDKLFANSLVDALKENYSKVNDIFIEIYGRDLPRVKNYWTSTTENQSIDDIFNTFIPESSLPSFTKERQRTRLPVPVNAMNKVVKYINGAEYLDNVAIKYRDLQRILKDRDVKLSITNKRGKWFYNNLLRSLKESSITKAGEELQATENITNFLLGNWITAKIGLNPDVFLKQLISVVNYSEQMPAGKWLKGFSLAVAKPKKTFDFMWKNSDYLRARFKSGYDETLKYALESSNSIMKGQTSSTIKNYFGKYKNFLSVLTRVGDVGAIIYGGYPLIKEYQAQGMSIKEAFDKFEDISLRAQQSPLPSSLSRFQNTKDPIRRMIHSFSNTPNQYARKLYQAGMDYRNGDITKKQLMKVWMIYAVMNGFLYSMEGVLIKSLFFGGDEPKEDDYKEAVNQIAMTPFGGYPILKDVINSTSRSFLGLDVYQTKTPIISDIANFARELSTEDYLDAFSISGEYLTGAPIKKIRKFTKN